MFFIMEEDRSIHNKIQFEDVESNIGYEFKPDEIAQIHDITVLFMKGNRDSIYPDVLETPVYMVSDRLKQIMEPYDPSVIYRRVALNQVEERIQNMYWLVLAEKINCLDGSSEFYPNGWDKKIVINPKKIGLRRIFKAEGILTPKLMVHLDVAESIMRRGFDGIVFNPIAESQEETSWQKSE